MRGCGAIPASSAKETESETSTLGHTCRFGVTVVFSVAGFRPRQARNCLAHPGGRTYYLVRLIERNLCVEAKGPKTSDAPPGLIRLIGREVGGDGLTRGAQTSPPRKRASDHGDRAAGVGVLN
jgi:hypothetical protein